MFLLLYQFAKIFSASTQNTGKFFLVFSYSIPKNFCEQLIFFLRIYRTLWKFRKLRRFESLDRTFRKSDCQLFWSNPSFTIHHLANLTFQHYHHHPPHCHHWHPNSTTIVSFIRIRVFPDIRHLTTSLNILIPCFDSKDWNVPFQCMHMMQRWWWKTMIRTLSVVTTEIRRYWQLWNFSLHFQEEKKLYLQNIYWQWSQGNSNFKITFNS